MAATRVRVLFEFRNGDGNFLSVDEGEFVDAKGKFDLPALDAAYLAALQKHGVKQKRIRKHLEKHQPANHD